VLITTERK